MDQLQPSTNSDKLSDLRKNLGHVSRSKALCCRTLAKPDSE
jgi:hypothetical protein